MKLLAGLSNPPLANKIAKSIGMSVGHSEIKRFSDQEISFRIEDNMRGEDVFIIQSTSQPANDTLMELLITIDALKRASAQRITAVIPYFGYSRQDRKGGRTAITAKLVGDLLTTAGAHHIITMDIHAGQIAGFFNIPFDNLTAIPTFAEDIERNYGKDVLIVSPDAGGVVRVRALADRLDTGLAIIDKRRQKANESEVMNIIGDVKGRQCIIFDDMADTAGTLCGVAEALMGAGAKSVSAYVTHGVLSGPALSRITASGLKEVVITDTINTTTATKVRVVSISELIGEAIRRSHNKESLSRLSQ